MDGPAFLDFASSHASCRDYTDEPVPDGLLERMVAAAQMASTDATGQLYSVIRVTEPQVRARAAALSGDQRHVHSAPEFLVVCLDVRRDRILLQHRDKSLGIQTTVALLFGITDAALFAQTLALAAEANGLGICFIGGVQNQAARLSRLLALPEGVVPLWGLTLGRPKSLPAPKPRLPVALVLHENTYRDPDAAAVAAAYETMSRATRSGDWVNALDKYFGADGVMARREEGFRALLEQQGLRL